MFPPLRNDNLLRAALGQPVDRIPVWIMRQAGRYLPEYMEFTKDKDFFTTCRNPQFAVEVTMQPIRRFDLDAAIIFSDILVIPQALGCEVLMVPKTGPTLPKPIRTLADLTAVLTKLGLTLTSPITFEVGQRIVTEPLRYVAEAITLCRHTLEGKVPLLGFAGSPWTLLCYMSEGGSSRLFNYVKKWVYAEPEACKVILELLCQCVTAFLVNQIDAGAQAVQVFDSHAGELPPKCYDEFSKPYLARIAVELRQRRPGVPLILFCKGKVCCELGAPQYYDVISVDFHHDISAVRAEVKQSCTLQGNLDPGQLNASPDGIRAATHAMIQSICMEGDGAVEEEEGLLPMRYIANLGHGITPDIDPEAVKVFIDAVHSFRKK